MNKKSKIIRTWKGWTTIENASIYEDLLINEIFRGVQKEGVKGLEKVTITRQIKNEEVEFLLILVFDSLDAIKAFAGVNYEIAYMPDKAKQVLLRYDETAQHHEFRKELNF